MVSRVTKHQTRLTLDWACCELRKLGAAITHPNAAAEALWPEQPSCGEGSEELGALQLQQAAPHVLCTPPRLENATTPFGEPTQQQQQPHMAANLPSSSSVSSGLGTHVSWAEQLERTGGGSSAPQHRGDLLPTKSSLKKRSSLEAGGTSASSFASSQEAFLHSLQAAQPSPLQQQNVRIRLPLPLSRCTNAGVAGSAGDSYSGRKRSRVAAYSD